MKRLQPLLPTLLALGILSSALVGSAGAVAKGVLAPGTDLLRADQDGLELVLRFDDGDFREIDGGVYADIAGCTLESADATDPRASGAPMLPRWRGLVALPPGQEAVLDWQLVASRAVDGEPLPFPTPKATSDGLDTLYDETLVRDAEAFAKDYPARVRLGETRWLRDQRVVELIAEPLGWSPATGLGLATELRVRVRFRGAAGARSDAAGRAALSRPDRLWPRLYDGVLLNPRPARAWRERVPQRAGAGSDRGLRATARLKLLTGEDGLYGVPGDSLIGRGIAAGTPLNQIAVYRRHFSWDVSEQPVYEERPEPRYFVDADADGLLDPGDTLVFVGWRLRHQPESVDPIEWYGREAALFVAVDPALVSEMPVETAWSDVGSWPLRDSFHRRRWVQGEEDFNAAPPIWFYAGVSLEVWDDNLYYWRQPAAPENYMLDLPFPAPAASADSAATLRLQFQGANRDAGDAIRDFSVDIQNGGGGCALPGVQVTFNNTVDYEATIPAGCLDPAGNTLHVDRSDSGQWKTFLKWYDLDYVSGYAALDDSLRFDADGALGPAEIQVSGLSADRSGWQLVRLGGGVGGVGSAPTRVSLGASNQTGSAGNYTLRLRRDLGGDEAWLLADRASLRAPRIATPADVASLDETAPVDVLVIAHDDFYAGMQRWVDRREDQGYRVRMLRASEVWDAFFEGVRGPIGIRNAARFAYQQWGAEALLLVGDADKDAREINPNAMPDFLPVHSKQEQVDRDELVALEEWVVKWQWNAWPSMLMGRLPVGNATELERILDKIECYESTDPDGPCAADAPWRKRFLLAADDCWVYDDATTDYLYCRANEEQFEIGVAAALPTVRDSWVGDTEAVPFYLSTLTDEYYLTHQPPFAGDISSTISPVVSPVYIDSLSQGYLWTSIQCHANRGLLCHEQLFMTSQGRHDQDSMTNVNRPFFWTVFGCHANEFANHQEARSVVGDCLGEKLLFLDQNRGAVASYASDGYEYLFPNIRWQKDWHEVMLNGVDPDGAIAVFPEWLAGLLQMVVELRFGDQTASYRTHLLGDPLLRLDMAPPRLRVFLNEQEMAPGDYVPAQQTGDTLRVEGLVWDETYLQTLTLRDSLRTDFAFTAEPAFTDELVAPLDSLAPFDTLAVAARGQGRAWHVSARIPYDFNTNAVVLGARDVAGRLAEFKLPVPKEVRVYLADEQLSAGQWIRPRGSLRLDILVPSAEIPPSSFALRVDGELSAVVASATELPNIYRMELDYDWAPGEHTLLVEYAGQDYGGLTLQVDASTRLLSAVIFPNPFREAITFQFELTNGARAGSLSIYTLSGRRIHRETLSALSEGQRQVVSWNGRDDVGDKVANGVYIARLVLTDLAGKELVWEDKVVRMR